MTVPTVASFSGHLSFPPRNDTVGGEWAAIYIEPMVGSGERLCIGVAAANAADFVVVPVVAFTRVSCLYGEAAKALMVAAKIALEDLRKALARSGREALRAWSPPMDGVFIGPPRESAGSSLEQIARTGLATSASLVEKLVEADEDETAAEGAMSANRLEQLIKEQVTKVSPMLLSSFGRERKLKEDARMVKIGFIGKRLAANFGIMAPKNLAGHVETAKAKLWDLEQLQRDFQSGLPGIPQLSQYELFLQTAREDDPEYSEKQIANVQYGVRELEYEAKGRGLGCRTFVSVDLMAKAVLVAEAA